MTARTIPVFQDTLGVCDACGELLKRQEQHLFPPWWVQANYVRVVCGDCFAVLLPEYLQFDIATPRRSTRTNGTDGST